MRTRSAKSIENAPGVQGIDGEGEYNFLTVVFTQGEHTKTVVRADLPSRKRHHDLANNAILEFSRTSHVRRQVLGGGMLIVKESDKQMIVHGVADLHGREKDRSITIKILGEAFPGFEIISRD